MNSALVIIVLGPLAFKEATLVEDVNTEAKEKEAGKDSEDEDPDGDGARVRQFMCEDLRGDNMGVITKILGVDSIRKMGHPGDHFG